MSKQPAHRLAAKLTDPSDVFLKNVHHGSRCRSVTTQTATRACPHEPTYAQSSREPDPPSSQLTLATEPFLFGMTAWIREVLQFSSTQASWQRQVGALHLAKLAVTVEVKKCTYPRHVEKWPVGARATQARAVLRRKKKNSARQPCGNIARVGLRAAQAFEWALCPPQAASCWEK